MPNQNEVTLPGQNDVLVLLFAVLDALGAIARRMHPAGLGGLVATLTDRDEALRSAEQAMDVAAGADSGAWAADQALREQIRLTSSLALQACDALRGAVDSANPMREAYRALRRYSRAQEALTGLAETVPAVGRYLLEPGFRDDPERLEWLAAPPNPDTGVFHFGNQTDERGGFSVYVPPWYEPARPHPVVVALHGGAGHGRLFLWNWVPEARTRRLIVIAPTAIGDTWALMEPEIDSKNLLDILTQVRGRWNVDASHMLLTGMSDGGTFTLVSGLDAASPITHLAPVAAAFHPLLLTMSDPRRLTGLPIYLVHGAMDWMFPVDIARTAYRALKAAGAAIVYRELADLSHAYPRDEQGAMLDWLLPMNPRSQ
jgi:phospholipase/carboxylesterase